MTMPELHPDLIALEQSMLGSIDLLASGDRNDAAAGLIAASEFDDLELSITGLNRQATYAVLEELMTGSKGSRMAAIAAIYLSKIRDEEAQMIRGRNEP